MDNDKKERAERCTLDSIACQLISLGRRLRDEVNLLKIERQLQSSDIDDRMDSALFTMSHLFYSGAIAEEQVVNSIKNKQVPDSIASHPDFDLCDEFATLRAWEGVSFDNTPNIIGSLSFLVVFLFLFEGFANLVIEKRGEKPRDSAKKIVCWLRKQKIATKRIDAVHFLNEYRNSWHAFGIHRNNKPNVNWDTLTLVPGERVPTPRRDQSMALLTEAVEVVLEVNRLRP